MENKKVVAFIDLGDGSQAKELKGFLNAVEIEVDLKEDEYKTTGLYVNEENRAEAVVLGSLYVSESGLDAIQETSTSINPYGVSDWIKEYKATGKIKDIEDLQEMDRRTEEENARLKAEEEAFLKGQSNS